MVATTTCRCYRGVAAAARLTPRYLVMVMNIQGAAREFCGEADTLDGGLDGLVLVEPFALELEEVAFLRSGAHMLGLAVYRAARGITNVHMAHERTLIDTRYQVPNAVRFSAPCV